MARPDEAGSSALQGHLLELSQDLGQRVSKLEGTADTNASEADVARLQGKIDSTNQKIDDLKTSLELKMELGITKIINRIYWGIGIIVVSILARYFNQISAFVTSSQ